MSEESTETIATETATETTATSTDPFAGMIGEGGKFNDGWLDRLPADYDAFKPSLKDVPDFGKLAKSYFDLKQENSRHRRGAEGFVLLPGENAEPEVVEAYRKATGVPDEADAYGFHEPPEGFDADSWNGEFAQGINALLHKHGVNPNLAPELKSAYAEFIQADQARIEQEQGAYIAEQRAGLEAKWGKENLAPYQQQANEAAVKLHPDAKPLEQWTEADQLLVFQALYKSLQGDPSLQKTLGTGTLNSVTSNPLTDARELQEQLLNPNLTPSQREKITAQMRQMFERAAQQAA
jgi:hypothetical protein